LVLFHGVLHRQRYSSKRIDTQSPVTIPQTEPQGTKIKQAEDVDTSQFPIVDYTAAKPTEPKERAKRESKSKKYNSRTAPRITESTDQIYSFAHWDVGLPALPVARSAAVIIGEITDAQAYLSDDQTNIYSEFAVRIDEVLKSDRRIILNPSSSVTVERAGGRVRFPSGKLAVSIINHQQMPRVGRRYVLFLTHDFLMGGEYDQDFFILTGYELRDGRVFPLDKTLPGHPITAYKGADQTSFMRDLLIAITDLPLTTQSK
jgi:hypothetical protein